ncbi:hypothetical protein DFR70_110241 [Nocardia tenerifensis]|uniref:Uncharacterized protein n=1 Tax=Nocardia tenerifensis TaxID=228006 RepID=A0A318JVZ4_9NOCA|nr:hypothetical protein [Nocardia tenerifensis]PXX60399.1 hypothetical protein DFR70_110241 [Nocardia tenerifensis]
MSREAGDPPGVRRAFTAAGTIASQGAVVGAVLYYFGVVYTRAWYGYFGVDVGMLGLSVPEYLIGSLTSSYWPAVVGLLIVLACYGLRGVPMLVAVRTRRPRTMLRRWTSTVAATGTALAIIVGFSVLRRDDLPQWMGTYLPIMLIISVALIGYAIALRETYPGLLSIRRSRRRPRSTPWLPILALLALGFLAVFWSVGSYARHRAVVEAENEMNTGFGSRPVVLLLSVDPLLIEGGGATVRPITAPDQKFRYSYSGLLLLARTPDRYFLIGHQWRKPQRHRVFIISNNDSIRVDLSPHP